MIPKKKMIGRASFIYFLEGTQKGEKLIPKLKCQPRKCRIPFRVIKLEGWLANDGLQKTTYSFIILHYYVEFIR